MLLLATVYAKHARHRSTCLLQSDMLLLLNERDKYIAEWEAEWQSSEGGKMLALYGHCDVWTVCRSHRILMWQKKVKWCANRNPDSRDTYICCEWQRVDLAWTESDTRKYAATAFVITQKLWIIWLKMLKVFCFKLETCGLTPIFQIV
jgi:hypothetical protein